MYHHVATGQHDAELPDAGPFADVRRLDVGERVDEGRHGIEKEIMNSFKTNNLIFPHILNLKFLYNDIPADPINIKNYSLNRYYGFFIDKYFFD